MSPASNGKNEGSEPGDRASRESKPTADLRRRLVAVLAADAVGYSKRIDRDQARALRAIVECRTLMTDAVDRHSGRVIATPGDFLLAEFSSAEEAVYCALELRRLLFNRNARNAAADRIKYRIGVALGDVMDDGGDIHGTAVNTAARLQAIAKPDQILVASALHDIVRSRANLSFSFVGERKLKNIRDPVRVYRVLRGPLKPREAVKAKIPPAETGRLFDTRSKHPKRPIIEIEEFKSLSREPTGSLFGRGLAEELVTTISRISSAVDVKPPLFQTLRGSGHPSVSASAGEPTTYKVDGSVRLKDLAIRVTARLVEMGEGITLWADRFSYELDDPFDVQEIIAREVITALQIVLTEGEQARLWDSKTTNCRAWELFYRGHDLERQYRRETHVEARQCYEGALELDPGFVPAVVSLGFCYLDEIRLGWARNVKANVAKAEFWHERAVALDADFPDCHALAAFINLQHQQHDEAIREMNVAVSLEPHSVEMTAYYGALCDHMDKFEEAIEAYQRAMGLSLFCPPWIPANLGLSYCAAGQLDKAKEAFEGVIETFPKYVRALIGLCVVHVRLGEALEAQRAAREVLRLDPGFSAEEWSAGKPFSNPELMRAFVRDLRAAGIP